MPNWVNALNTIAPALGILNTLSLIKDIITVATGSSPVALILDVILNLAQLVITCVGDGVKDKTMGVYYNFDLNSSNPLPLQFKRVEIIEGGGIRGRTIHEFTSDDDYAPWFSTNPTYSAKQRYASWAYGLPKRVTYLDNGGIKVKEIENGYDFTSWGQRMIDLCFSKSGPCNPSGISSDLISVQCTVNKSSSQRSDDWANSTLYNASSSYITPTNTNPDLIADFYGYYTGRVLLTTTKERTYKQNDANRYVESVKTYEYNSSNYEVKLETFSQSDGTGIQKEFGWSSDYSGGIYNIMSQNNILAIPISTRTKIINSQHNGYLNEDVTEYTQLSDGEIKPYRKLQQRVDHPVSIWSYYSSATDYSKFITTQTFAYDALGNLIGAQDEGGRTISNIYDYNDKYIIASAINADPLTDKIAYTSFETDKTGGWDYLESLQYNTSQFVTGSRALQMIANGILKTTLTASSLNTLKPYKLSFWATGNNITVWGNATLVKFTPTINGFTYYEYNIAQGTSSVSLTTSVDLTIDELRLYPATARMKTATYEPLIGKTSECDENNRTTYYEYDNSGRLQFIKDDKKNIVKMYEYNNVSASKQNGCPGIYYNHYISEVFTKNDCGTNFLGNDVTVSVAANIYSSVISQEDADRQAELYLLTYGQGIANSNGGCTQLYGNDALSQPFTTQNCDNGQSGGEVVYSVPANKYYATSKADANQMAQDEIDANGQAYANNPLYAICTIDTNPHWEAEDGSSTQCQMVNGEMHLMIWATDVNPNSASYGTQSWKDLGPSSSCIQPEFYIQNDLGCGFTVEFTNTFTGEQFFFFIDAHSTQSGVIPNGTYNISIVNGCNLNATYSVFGNNYYSNGTSADFYNVYYDGSCNWIYIHP